MKKFIVITSISHPTEAVRAFAKKEGWQLIVVGDKKTPQDWKYEQVIYLSPEDQEKLGFLITDFLPWNHYARKMVGYLYAIKNGADIIADSDDDNIPLESWGDNLVFGGEFQTVKNDDYVNMYKFFTDKFVWPRGFPLDKILNEEKNTQFTATHNVGVWQYLADKDPDVDAIYRLTNNSEILFQGVDRFVLEKGTICPFNSQNTFFCKEMFPLLYLPAFVSFRFTDILRGLVAQPIMWSAGYQLGFGPATVVQERNPHDFMKDFESEIPMIMNIKRVREVGSKIVESDKSVADNFRDFYQSLIKEGIVDSREGDLVDAWLSNFT